MMSHVPLNDILFIDVETVPQHASFDKEDEEMQVFWDKKSAYFRGDEESAADVYQRAGIYSEFGKIICISAGFIHPENGVRTFREKSYYGDDEAHLLKSFASMLEKFEASGGKYLCGHNSREFDIPYIARRMLINGICLPDSLDLSGKKPWEVRHIDTMDLWKFGDYKHFTSLALLAQIFEIPTPKDDIDGSQVAEVYYKDKDIERIAKYCEKDVLAVAQLFLRFRGEPLIEEAHVKFSV